MKTFEFDGLEITEADLLRDNSGDDELIDWIGVAEIGDTFCGCRRIA